MMRRQAVLRSSTGRDALFATVFAAAATGAISHGHGLTAGLVLLTWATALPLALRRVWPRAVLGWVTAAETLYAALDFPGGPVYLAALVAIYTIATVSTRRHALIYAGASVATIYAGALVGSGVNGLLTPIHLLFVSWAGAAVLGGDASKNRGRYISSLRERARQAEETREEEARRRVAEERVRIARDLHDVVAHALATITVQAAAGSRVLDSEPERTRQSLTAIRETSKQALQDLRATLDMLRPTGEGAPTRPAPGLADISLLLEGPAAAGIDVQTSIEGSPYTVDPGVDVAAYRILQESLTNVVRHAAASHASILLRYAQDHVELEVVNDGNGSAAADGHGHGVLGMRERAESVGGTLTAGPGPSGGFRVWTRLPTGGRQ